MKTFIVSLLVLLSFSTAFSQENHDVKYVDSLIDAIETFSLEDVDTLISMVEEAERVAKKINYKNGIFQANLFFAHIKRDLSPKMASKHIKVLDDLIANNPKEFDDTTQVNYYLVKGYMEGTEDNYLDEIKWYLVADSIAMASEKDILIVHSKQYVCYYYYHRKEYENALSCNRDQIYFHKSHEDTASYAYANYLVNAANIYAKLRNMDSVIHYGNAAIRAGYHKMTNPCFLYTVLGEGYLNKGDMKNAAKYAQLTKKHLENIELSSIDGVKAELFFGKLAARRGQFSKAKDHFMSALEHSNATEYGEGRTEAYFGLLINSLQESDNVELLKYLESFRDEKDLILNRSTSKEEKELLISYQTEKKEMKIRELLLTQKYERNKTIAAVVIALLLALLLTTLIFIQRSRRQLMGQRLESEKLKKKIINDELEHKTNLLDNALQKTKDDAVLIRNLKESLNDSSMESDKVNEMMEILSKNYVDENNWAKILLHFDSLNGDLVKDMKDRNPSLTNNDLRMIVLVKLGYSTSGIADINNISEQGVKKAKQRLIKRLQESDRTLIFGKAV